MLLLLDVLRNLCLEPMAMASVPFSNGSNMMNLMNCQVTTDVALVSRVTVFK